MQRRREQGAKSRVYPIELAFTAADSMNDHVHRAPTEWWPPLRREGQGGRPAPPVGRFGHLPTAEQLRREVPRRAHDEPRHGQADVIGHVRDAKVNEHRAAIEHQDIAGFQIAMNHSHRVHGLQRIGKSSSQLDQVGTLQRTGVSHVLVQRRAGHVSGHQIRPWTVDIGVKDRRHAGVLDPGQGGDLTGQPGLGLVIVGDVIAQHLHGHRPPRLVQPQVDHAHATLTEALQQAVSPQHHRSRRSRWLLDRRGDQVGRRGQIGRHGQVGWIWPRCWVMRTEPGRLTHADPFLVWARVPTTVGA